MYIILLLSLISCGGTKKISTTTAEALSAKQVFKLHEDTFPEFNTLAARVQVAHQTIDKEQRITISLRMKKDEVIWAKAAILGITVAKVYITPKKVMYYETVGGTYFEGDFALLSEWIGMDVNFEQTQNILLGQSIFNLSSAAYSSEISQNKFKVQPKKQLPNFILSLFINPGDYRVASTSVEQPEYERILYLRYGDYQMLQNQYFPTTIAVVSTESGEQTKIGIDYKKIDINADVSFPFEIPSGYKRIEL
ncbi:MAG TPA: DUF4292 domain-containing protein [Flavobacteriaceae bacterium]|nr:DUF4292 domain-containing protein [Flavobacteriaceae bacterium]